MRRKRVILAGCATIIICAVLYHFTRPPDPVYEGRKLSEWLKDLEPQTIGSGFIRFDETFRDDEDSALHNAAVRAIQGIGTNALPYLKARLAPDRNFLWDNLPNAWVDYIVKPDNNASAWLKERTELHQCLFACYVLGPKASALAPDVFEYGMDGGPSEIWSVIIRFGWHAVPHLIPMLSITNEGRHHMALGYLEDIGPSASAAIPAVIRMLNTSDQKERGETAYALATITDDPKKTVGPLLKLLSETNSQIHENIADGMFTWNSAGKAAGPALLKLALDTNSPARLSAALALAKVDANLATNVLDDLKKIALTNDFRHTLKAREALEAMGPAARPIVDDLFNAVMLPIEDDWCILAIAVIKIDPEKGKQLLPRMIEHLQYGEWHEKFGALEALSLLGRSAEPALPFIMLMDDYDDTELKIAALNALHAITSAPSAVSTRVTPP